MPEAASFTKNRRALKLGGEGYTKAHNLHHVNTTTLGDLPEQANSTVFFHRQCPGKVSDVELSRQSKIPISEFKRLLGSAASGLSDSEIERLRDLEDRLADIVFDSWLRNRNPQPEVAKLSK